MSINYDIVIVGGGPAGMAAAIEAKKYNNDLKILLLEREEMLGGALNQCVHCGFGNEFHKDLLSGTEYIQEFVDEINELKIEYKLNSTVLSVKEDKRITYVNPKDAMKEIKAKAIILTTGIRELFSGNISIPLNKFTGIYTVGTAHKFVTIRGYIPGKDIVILGSSDSTLIIARRLLIEGANIKAIIESSKELRAKSKSARKIVEDFNIPVLYGHRVDEVKGTERVSSVIIEKIDDNKEDEEPYNNEISCDCLLISVNFLPEKDLGERIGAEINKDTLGIAVNEKFKTNIDGIFAAGGVTRGYDSANTCITEGKEAGKEACNYCLENK
ncbi:MAG: NAD(P)/FAD-dependent oxidoreductase [Sarcina sp.]